MVHPDNVFPENRKRPGTKKRTLHQLRIDMTPMVDLGFLLITFFVITTELSKPTAIDLIMPKDGTATDLGASYALTVLLDEKQQYYYHGDWNDAVKTGEIGVLQSIEDIRAVISKKQLQLDDTTLYREGRKGLMLLIKPTTNTDYKTVIDLLDETIINDVSKYAIIKISEKENKWVTDNK